MTTITVTDPRATVRLIRSMVTKTNMQEFIVDGKDLLKFIATVRVELARAAQVGKYEIKDLKLPTGNGFIVKVAK